MPLPVGHTLASWILVSLARGKVRASRNIAFLLAAVVAGNLPDIDFLPVLAFGKEFMRQYHQGVTHSLGFALLMGLLFAGVFHRRGVPLVAGWGFFSLVIYVHVLLDALGRDTTPPIGVMLFWPLSDERFLSPVNVFPGVRKATWADLLSLWNLFEILVEVLVLLPVAWGVWACQRRRGLSRSAWLRGKRAGEEAP